MAKIIIQKVGFYSDSSFNTLIGEIEDVVVGSRELSVDPNTVNIDDNQVINESYTTNPTFRTRSTKYVAGAGGTADGNDILGGENSPVSIDGTKPAKTYVKFVGASNSIDIESGAMYLNGYEAFDNERNEVVVSGQLEAITASDAMTSAAATGS